MSRLVALGERHLIEGLGLAGVAVVPAEDAPSARAAWASLADDVAVVVLTAAAERAIGDDARSLAGSGRRRLVAVIPP